MNPKIWIVVQREFVGTVCRKGWLIGTFGMPVFVGLYAGLVALVATIGERSVTIQGKVGIVDRAGVVRLEEGKGGEEGIAAELPAEARAVLRMGTPSKGPAAELLRSLTSRVEFQAFPDEASGLRTLDAKQISALYVVPEDYLATGVVRAYTSRVLTGGKTAEIPIRRLLVRSLAADRVPADVLERVLSPASVETWSRQRDGSYQKRGLATIVRSIGLPLGFMLLLLISLMVSSGYLLQGVSEEKENRVIEVILSSVDARSLLVGKLLGLGGSGLLQLAIWLTMALVPVVVLIAGLTLSPALVLLCLVYFVLGFLLYGALMTATGVIGTNLKDMQQYGMMWSIVNVIPVVFFEAILSEPNGAVARVLTYIPLTCPTVMVFRLGSGEVPWWEVALTIPLLAGSVWLVVRLAARVFRTALLMYGKRPAVREVFRWLREA